ncbi:hypothetical protein BC830DRAFT_1130954 [Chytriomyces sp. MP71]|nr:hypothetical protein BC830DRAFT_1130954 [Chytriomyces sp. MP71]
MFRGHLRQFLSLMIWFLTMLFSWNNPANNKKAHNPKFNMKCSQEEKHAPPSQNFNTILCFPETSPRLKGEACCYSRC